MGLNDGEFMRWWVMTSRWRDMDGWMNEAHIILLPDVVMNRDSKQDEINLIEPVKSNLICIYSPLIQWLIGTRDKCIIYQLHPVFLSLTVNKVAVSLELSFQSNVNQKYSSFSEPEVESDVYKQPDKSMTNGQTGQIRHLPCTVSFFSVVQDYRCADFTMKHGLKCL